MFWKGEKKFKIKKNFHPRNPEFRKMWVEKMDEWMENFHYDAWNVKTAELAGNQKTIDSLFYCIRINKSNLDE